MNTDQMEHAVQANFKDRLAVLALIDAIEDDGHVSHSVAVRRAVQVRREAKRAALRRLAAEYLSPHYAGFSEIRDNIGVVCSIPPGAPFALEMVDRGPRIWCETFTDERDEWGFPRRVVKLRPAVVLVLVKIIQELNEDTSTLETIWRNAKVKYLHKKGGQHDPPGP